MTNHRISVSFCIAVICLLACLCRGGEPDGSGAFVLPDKFFPIMCWELPPSTGEFADPGHGLTSLADCGFTTAGFVRPEHLARCEKLGLKALTVTQAWNTEWRKLSDQQIFDVVKKLVDETGDSKAVMGYFLTDEPSALDFPALGKAVAAVKKLAPGKLAYINLFPDYATLGAPDISQLGTGSYTEYLERFVREVKPQFISYDNYRIQYSTDLKDPALVASYYNNLLEVRRIALKYDLPFWNIVGSNQILPGTPPPSPANLLVAAYTSLAAGAQGLTWYTYYGGGYHYGAVDKTGSRTATWSYLKMVNDQVKILGPIMRPLKSTGVYFTSPPPVKSLPALPGQLVAELTSGTPVMVGEFSGPAGEKWVMLVNLSLERTTQLKFKPRGTYAGMRSVSPVDGSLSPVEGDHSIWLTAGQGVLIKFQ